ncbi:MAG: DUF393 domain-containing protein, partial [Acidobacteriota bacterium]
MGTSPAAIERIFYDGDCGVCHWSVSLVARSDRRRGAGADEAFRFAPLGGEAFQQHVPPEIARDLPDSLIVQTADGSILLRSDGLIHILSRLGFVERCLGALLRLVPRPIRNYFYDRFAERRHRFAERP